MMDRNTIKAFVGELARQFHPQGVVLFGSCASGRPHAYSDVDLLVIMRHNGHAAVQAAEIRKQRPRWISIGLARSQPAGDPPAVGDGRLLHY